MMRIALTAAAFLVMVFFIMRPRSVRIPLTKRRLPLDYVAGSVLGALMLILSGLLTPDQTIGSLVGREGFRPYTIIILFMAVAYIAISLDSTGFFEYIALKIVLRAGNDGRKLFLYFYLLSGFITLFTSNDIVILTMTPIIFYFTKHAKIRMLPFLVAEFFAANLWSMAFYFSNPTNIIAAQAHGLGFFEFSAWMILPTIASGVVCYALLYAIFRKDINIKFHVPKAINPSEFLHDRHCAFVTFFVFCTTVGFLAASPVIGLEMWIVSLFFALLLFGYDVAVVYKEHRNEGLVFYRKLRKHATGHPGKVYSFRLHLIAERMPWKVVPFLVCSFIMVEGLVVTGVTDYLAAAIAKFSSNVFFSAISMGFLSSFAANLINNQPMTVLFTKITESSQFALTGGSRLASVFSLIIGSNLGANITLIGALAGIMWIKIIRDKKQVVSYADFARLGLMVTPVVILTACGVLAIEFFLVGI